MLSQMEGKHNEHPAPDLCDQKPDAEVNVMTAFAIAH